MLTPLAQNLSPLVGSAALRFSPSQVAGLQVWLRADAITGLSDGDAVSFWPDASGEANHASAVGSARPTWRSGVLNGKPVVRFDGVDDGMTVADSASYKAAALTMFLVFRTLGGSFYLIAGYPHATSHVNPYYRWALFRVDTCLNLRIDFDPQQTPSGIDLDHFACYAYDTSTRGLWRDGVTLFDGPGGVISYPNATGLRIGFSIEGLENFNGDIAEMLIYDTSLAVDDREAVQGYLEGKYGL